MINTSTLKTFNYIDSEPTGPYIKNPFILEEESWPDSKMTTLRLKIPTITRQDRKELRSYLRWVMKHLEDKTTKKGSK